MWLQRSAAQGYAPAQYSLGRTLEYLDTVSRSQQRRAEALRLFRLSAEQGHPGAQYVMGQSYAEAWAYGKTTWPPSSGIDMRRIRGIGARS